MAQQGIDVQYQNQATIEGNGGILYGTPDPIAPTEATQYEASAATDIQLAASVTYAAINDNAALRNVDLPALSSVSDGHKVTVARLGGGGANVVVRPLGTDTIDDGAIATIPLTAAGQATSLVAVRKGLTTDGWFSA